MANSQTTQINLTVEEVEQANARGDVLFEQFLGDTSGGPEDAGAVAYAMLMHLALFLAEYGWAADELSKDVATYVQNNYPTDK